MYKKLSLGLVLVLMAPVFLSACHSATVSKALDCANNQVLCIGLVTGLSGVKDQSYNQMAWEGILRAQTEKVADRVQYIETIDAKDYDANLATLVGEGFDIVVTAGNLYREATTSAAQQYPGTLFIGVDQDHGEDIPNLVGLVFHEDQAGFQAGALAALLTKTNTIAAVYGPAVFPTVVDLNDGFAAGARYINPNIKIISSFYSNTAQGMDSDPRWAAGAASQAIQAGADIIFDGGGTTGNGALVEAASYPGTYCIGNNVDQWDSLPDAHSCLITSSIKLVSQGVFDILKRAREGSFPSGNYFSTTELAPYHDFDSVIPQTVKDEISQVIVDLNTGAISTSSVSP